MPIYEYQCTDCGYETEVIQKFSDPIKTECENCGKSTFRKKLSLPSFQLKGGGWYNDGYGTKKESAGSADKPANDKTGSSESGKEDGKTEKSKPETTAPSDKSAGVKETGSTKSKSADLAKSKSNLSERTSGKTPSQKSSTVA